MEYFEVVHTQRAIRSFKPDPVPDDLLWQALDAAIRAPSGSNTQPWRWMVVRDRAKIKAIAKATEEGLEKRSGLARMRQEAESLDDPVRRRSRMRFLNFVTDFGGAPVVVVPCLVNVTSPVTDARSLLAGSSIYGAVQNLMLAARALGLGTVLTTFNSFIEDTLRRELQLPHDVVPACVIPMGFPNAERFGPTTRKPIETVTYWDTWGREQAKP